MGITTDAPRTLICFCLDAGAVYALGLFVVGNIIIGTADVLVKLATNAGTTSTALWPAFILAGLGQILAVACCPKVYRALDGDMLLLSSFVLTTGLWVVGPYLYELWMLYSWFFARGVVGASILTGVQIMTRRVYGEAAGPRLAFNPSLFALAGAASPLVSYLTANSLEYTCFVYVLVAAVAAVVMAGYISKRNSVQSGTLGDKLVQAELAEVFASEYAAEARISSGSSKRVQDVPRRLVPAGYLELRASDSPQAADCGHLNKHQWDTATLDFQVPASPRVGFLTGARAGLYNTDLLLALMLFLSVGGEAAVGYYLTTFVLETEIISGDEASMLLSSFWLSMVVGRLIAMVGQRNITTKTLYVSLCVICFASAVTPTGLLYGGLTDNWQSWQAWFTFLFWGLVLGPTQGYIYDISNRMCGQSEEASSILIGGLQLGATFITVGLAAVWDSGVVGAVIVPFFMCSIGALVSLSSLFIPCVNQQLLQALRSGQ